MLLPIPQLLLISRILHLLECLRRKISRMFRIDDLFRGMVTSLNFNFKKALSTILFYASLYLQNCCPVSSGITVRIQMEWLSGMEWNHCPLSRGMGVRIALEYSPILSQAVSYKKRLATPALSTIIYYNPIWLMANIALKDVFWLAVNKFRLVLFCTIHII